MDALCDFYIDHPFAYRYKTAQDKGHSQHILKKIVFWIDDYQF